ncbi:malignant fibrous histiocytoma-amplified sequence 1 homolog [Branchiostoma lanceolatum]|uniref:malignant fibrous histiocytoma-amplified sequence 1 homolog n=1 Tax=Branchiostoma lanceolatum TaxID=7740 RepID=UPI003451AC8E
MANILDSTLATIQGHGGYANWGFFVLLILVAFCLIYIYTCVSCNGANEEDEVANKDIPLQQTRQGSSTVHIEKEQDKEQPNEERTNHDRQGKKRCDKDPKLTFLFNRHQYTEHSNREEIRITRKHTGNRCLTIFPEIGQFKQLKKVEILDTKLDDDSLLNLFQCTSIRSLTLSECHIESVPISLVKLKDLENLDLSDNKIEEIPPEILEMKNLKTLVCRHNKIKTLPQLNMTKVSKTIEKIDLCDNEICEVPAAFLMMPTLKALYLDSNKITTFSTGWDPNKLSTTLLDIDLRNNELDHIPQVLCLLPSLTTLVLKKNKIGTISKDVKSCKKLELLNISANMLKELPSHLFCLPKLIMIDASNNQITSVSALRKGDSSVVAVIFLVENGLSDFPEALIDMETLRNVDLSNNEIKVIPQTIMAMTKDVTLKLQDNPIIDPPLQVCQGGIQAIQAFYEDLTKDSPILKCLKTLILGTYGAGKTSLVRALKLGRSKLTKPGERTHGIEIAEFPLSAPDTPDRMLSVWDFAGQDIYYITHQFFLSAKALMLLVVNLEEYKCDSVSFNGKCGKWMKNMVAKVGNPVVIPVATHIDKLSIHGEVQRRCDDLAKRLEDQERIRLKDLERQRESINEPSMKSSGAARARKKQIESLLQQRPSIHPKPVPVSSANLNGIQDLKQVILDYATNKTLFPGVGHPIPKAWADTEACVERKSKDLSFPYITWREFTALLKKNVPNLQPESRIKTVAQYLHDTGKILWYSEIESLKNHVFLKPASLVDIFRKVIRPDLEAFIDYNKDPCYKEVGITQADFDRMKSDLVNRGVLHIKLLRCMWSDVEKECSLGETIFNVLIKLMLQFELCYDIDDGRTRDNQGHPVPRRLLVPWHIQDDVGDITKWESPRGPIISIQYQFPSFIPPGLFARFTVRAHHPKSKLHFYSHWNTGTLCKHKKHKILVLLKNESGEMGVEGSEERLVISLSARSESKSKSTSVALWETLIDLSLEMDELLKQWPGVQYKQYVVCPNCHKPSFAGLQKRASSRSRSVICYKCNERVPKNLLSPSQRTSSRLLSSTSAVDTSSIYLSDKSQPSDQQLLRVARGLGAEWESLAIRMGFTKADVDEFKSDHPHNTRQQKFTMLTAWRRRLGSEASTRRLQCVLQSAGVDYDAISCLDETDISFDLGNETSDDDATSSDDEEVFF